MTIQYFLAVLAVVLCIPLIAATYTFIECEPNYKIRNAMKRFMALLWIEVIVLVGIRGLAYMIQHGPLHP